MNTQLTPQEAALYLGQEIQYTNHFFGSTKFGKLTPAFFYDLFGSSGYRYTCKLLLRPLADIQEEEAKEFLLFVCDNAQIDAVNGNGILYKENFLGVDLKTHFTFESYTPAQFQYLLSKGFDLFNWIEQGKALDKTKATVVE